MKHGKSKAAWGLFAWTLVGLLASQAAEAGETRLRIQGHWADGTRHVDKLYLSERPEASQFVAVSLRWDSETSPANTGGTAVADELGRGVWQRDGGRERGPWRCFSAVFEAELQVTIWVNRTSDQVLYYGYDRGGRLQVWGTGEVR